MYSVKKRAMDGQGSLATFLAALLALLLVLVVAVPALGKDGRGSRRGASADRGRSPVPSLAARGRHGDGGAGRSDGRSRATLGSGNGNDAGNGRASGSGGRDRGRQPGYQRQDGASGPKRRGGRHGDNSDGPLASTASTGKHNQSGDSVAGPSSTGGGSPTSGGRLTGSSTGSSSGGSTGGEPNPSRGGSNSSGAGTGAEPSEGVLPTLSSIGAVVAAPKPPAAGTTGAVAGQRQASGSTRGDAATLQRLLSGAATGNGLAPLVSAGAATPSARRPAQRSTKPAAAASGNGNASGGAVKEIRKIVERVPGIVWAALAALGGLALVLVPLALVSTARSRHRGRLVEQLESIAATDALTGLLNRGALERGLQAELGRAQRYGRPLSLVYFDVNGLKAINDVHGHATGDRLLQTIAQLFADTSRDHDLCGRMGGDECVVVLTEQDAAGAAAYGERVLERLPEKRSELGLASQWGLTAGIAAFPEDGETAAELLAAADQRLYLQRGIRIEPRSA